jgi:hypothetical protein
MYNHRMLYRSNWCCLDKSFTNILILLLSICFAWNGLLYLQCDIALINRSTIVYTYIYIFLYICCIQVYCHVFILYQNIKVLLKKTVSIWSKTPEFLPNSYYIYESLFDMVPMDVLHACQFLDIIHLYLKHDFWQVKTFILSFLTKKI